MGSAYALPISAHTPLRFYVRAAFVRSKMCIAVALATLAAAGFGVASLLPRPQSAAPPNGTLFTPVSTTIPPSSRATHVGPQAP